MVSIVYSLHLRGCIVDLYEAIFERRTIHNYVADPVADEVIDRCLAAAHMAPNHKFTWPWRFTVVGHETRERLIPIACRLKNAQTPNMVERIRSKLMNPGALIVVTQLLDGDDFRQKEDYAATCCAIQNLLLAARAEGLGSKWSTGALTQHPDVCGALSIDGTTELVVGFVWIGTPEVTPTIERPVVEQHIRRLT